MKLANYLAYMVMLFNGDMIIIILWLSSWVIISNKN